MKQKRHNYQTLQCYDSRRRKWEIIAMWENFLLEENKHKFKLNISSRDVQNLVDRIVVVGV